MPTVELVTGDPDSRMSILPRFFRTCMAHDREEGKQGKLGPHGRRRPSETTSNKMSPRGQMSVGGQLAEEIMAPLL